MKYLSHLDMLQLFTRAARRCRLPVAYSSGFNPHPLFVFGMPLPVGVTSEAEYLDLELTEALLPEAVMQRFNGTLPEGISVAEVIILPPKADNIMKSVVASEYTVQVYFSGVAAEQEQGGSASFPIGCAADGAAALCKQFQAQRPLIIEKRSKSGIKETDVRPMIFEISLLSAEDGHALMRIVTAAGNTVNLRPELAVEALAAAAGVRCETKQIHRVRLIHRVKN